MPNSLRDEVEKLAIEFDLDDTELCGYGVATCLRLILARHPPADGVLVPRQLLERLQFHSIGLSNITQSESHMFEITSDVTQADAILSATDTRPGGEG